MSSAASWRMAAQAAAKEGSGLTLDPDAAGAGIHDWLKGIGAGHALAAASAPRAKPAPPHAPEHEEGGKSKSKKS